MSVVGRVSCPHCLVVNNVENVLCHFCNKRLDEKPDLQAKVLDPTAAVEEALSTWGDLTAATRNHQAGTLVDEPFLQAYARHADAVSYLADCFKLMRAQDLAKARAENEAQEKCVIPREVAVPLLLHCPGCGARHVDEGEWAEKPHHTHSCQACGFTWRPAVVPTVGVKFLPGFKNG